ncbi:TorF family putative porin [Parasphingorhabdus sp. JC815]|uniref:TorF family putative porin n=1 Tax=Parasphingorhabdus sp. JC815 TaxID=3232140 RepID=UPI003459B1F9
MIKRPMKKSCNFKACGALLLFPLCWSAGANAQEARPLTAPPPSIDVSFNIGAVSDYRFRGLSFSDRDPALQGGIDIYHQSGLFAGAWATTIAEYSGSDIELDLYGGYAGEAGGLEYTASAYYYVYPGGKDANYLELQGIIGKTIGPAQLEVVMAYTPDQDNAVDNLYLGAGANVAIPNTPYTVKLRGGRENGAYDNKWDWQAGITYSRDWLTISASYIDTDYSGITEAGRNGRAGFVASVTASF